MGRSRREIKEYLDALDLTVDIDIQTLPVGREKNYKRAINRSLESWYSAIQHQKSSQVIVGKLEVV